MEADFAPFDESTHEPEFEPARFTADLKLPPAADSLLKDAAVSIRQEFRDCSKWKRLRCRKVSVFAERDRGIVYVVHVGMSVEFDWTWEGAVAFRPRSLDDNVSIDKFSYEDSAYEDEILWRGEILEVDERNGCLFISLDNPEAAPTVGSFFVRPFEFLSVLDSVFNDPVMEGLRRGMAGRLAATVGDVHPRIKTGGDFGLPQLHAWWRHSWCVLWGPPGTGKTWTTGQQVAAVLDDPTERILVVSTTNKATDAVAVSIGNAARSRDSVELDDGSLLRIGKGASHASFAATGLESMLVGTESLLLQQIDELASQLRLFDSWEEKALTRKRMKELRSGGGDPSRRNFLDPDVRVVVATAFKATSFLKNDCVCKMLEADEAPFTTVIVDEAGLMSRTSIAALSLLAARRVVLVGDSKQLAPISQISRILPLRQQTWLASSGLSHLDDLERTPRAVHVLSEQRRMHRDVCRVVSDFQYGGALTTAPEVDERPSHLPEQLANHARMIWYMLDAEGSDLGSIRAERGPGNKSWVRSITPQILERLFIDRDMCQTNGLFISPYKAQARMIAKWFADRGLDHWDASTVHSQQGSEADVVIFDTVNAGSYQWPFEEWKRLINVAISRAREAVIVLATRGEMEEPYLRPLRTALVPSRLVDDGVTARWERLSDTHSLQSTTHVAEPPSTYALASTKENRMGDQIRKREMMTPVLSKEQRQLTNLKLDGKPRLVRGVAGSGKSIVLCNWLAKTVQRLEGEANVRIWAVYANRSLHNLLRESIESAWASLSKDELYEPKPFPWEKVVLLHVKDVLAGMLPSVALSMESFDFDYDRAAEEYLNRQTDEELLPRCSALFIDEAQDMGPFTLKLLLSLVEQADPQDPKSRPAHIFYDNAQNLYDRRVPKWSEFGLDMRGRSTIMRESFRSTTPITELAVNVLHRLTETNQQDDQRELMKMGLIETCERDGDDWLKVRFNQVDGPKPILRLFDRRTDELDAMTVHLKHLITSEAIAPKDICIIYNSKSIVQFLESVLKPRMAEIGVELSIQTNRSFQRQDNTLIVTTSNSYKGYESEVVMIPGVDQFVSADGQTLSRSLYVAMTRARSLLCIYGTRQDKSASRRITRVMEDCIARMNFTPQIESASSLQDDVNDILERIGGKYRDWLTDLWSRFDIRQEPILDVDAAVLAEPLFWFEHDGKRVACFVDSELPRARRDLQASGVMILKAGEVV